MGSWSYPTPNNNAYITRSLNTMKTKIIRLYTIIHILYGLSSCDSSDSLNYCSGGDCGQFGVCNDGECICLYGSEFDPEIGECITVCDSCPPNTFCNSDLETCECLNCFEPDSVGNCVPSKLKYLGTWTGYHISKVTPGLSFNDTSSVYSISITETSRYSENVLIGNFMNLFCSGTNEPLIARGICSGGDITVGYFSNQECFQWTVYTESLVELSYIENDTLKIHCSVAESLNSQHIEDRYYSGFYTRN